MCESLLKHPQITSKTLDLVFLQELYGDEGKINEHFEYILDVSLARLKQRKIYERILIFLSEGSRRLSEIADYMGRKEGEVKKYIEFLVKGDLIFELDNYYQIKDILFKAWLRKKYFGISEFDLRRDKLMDNILKELEEKFLKVSTELGVAKESELREKFMEAGLNFKPYIKGNLEFDGVAKKGNLYYILEIKWRNRLANYGDLKKFVKRVESLKFRERKPIFISKSGFTEKALEFADENNVIVADRRSFGDLVERLKTTKRVYDKGLEMPEVRGWDR